MTRTAARWNKDRGVGIGLSYWLPTGDEAFSVVIEHADGAEAVSLGNNDGNLPIMGIYLVI